MNSNPLESFGILWNPLESFFFCALLCDVFFLAEGGQGRVCLLRLLSIDSCVSNYSREHFNLIWSCIQQSSFCSSIRPFVCLFFYCCPFSSKNLRIQRGRRDEDVFVAQVCAFLESPDTSDCISPVLLYIAGWC